MKSRGDLRIVGQDRSVPVVGGRVVPYINLDNAASTPPLVEVARKVEEFLPWYSSVHRGAGFKSRMATEIYEDARMAVASFFGYDPHTNVVLFCKNTTEALNKLAHRWPWRSGDVVVSSLAEHHSNDLPWRDKAYVLYLGLRRDGTIDLDHLSWCLSRYAPYVRLVTLTGASNVTGCLTDIHQAARLSHLYGAKIAVDGAQLAAHRRIDALSDVDPYHLDFLAISGHKIYAPFGSGALIGPYAFFAEGKPDYPGGGTVKGVTLATVNWADPPDRDEPGTPNVVGAVALAASLDVLQRADLCRIEEFETALTARLYEGLSRLPGIILYGPPVNKEKRVGIVSFNITGLPHGLVAAVLSCEAGIGVRSGCFCARPYVQRLLGLDEAEALRYSRMEEGPDYPGMVRASLGLYNQDEEIDRLLETVRDLTDDPDYYLNRYEYDQVDGYWWPKDWRPDYGSFFRLFRYEGPAAHPQA